MHEKKWFIAIIIAIGHSPDGRFIVAAFGAVVLLSPRINSIPMCNPIWDIECFVLFNKMQNRILLFKY